MQAFLEATEAIKIKFQKYRMLRKHCEDLLLITKYLSSDDYGKAVDAIERESVEDLKSVIKIIEKRRISEVINAKKTTHK